MQNYLFVIISVGLCLSQTNTQNATLNYNNQSIPMISNGQRNTEFYQSQNQFDCGMPKLYILKDNNHSNYTIMTKQILVSSIQGKYQTISASIACVDSDCTVSINNQCETQSDKHEINWILMETSAGELEYLVDCKPDQFYKPFQWGLLLVIMFSTLTLTLSSLYSRAWSYGGVGYNLTLKAVIVFNFVLLIGVILAYIIPSEIAIAVQIISSIIGASGVAVCVSETIWLTHNKNYLKKVYKMIRIIDVISFSIGIVSIAMYWLLNGQWIINDVLAVCSIVALMKLVKVRSLAVGVCLMVSLLLLQILVGLFVHYVFKISYNNYIINIFQSPIIFVMPSITHELYRKCAWLPISAVLIPGLILSYLRRFDKTRGTFLYFIIGLVSFYFGSIIWMVIDLQTVHALPFAIISEPVIILIVIVQSYKRNQFKNLWKGNFHDEELSEGTEHLINKQTQIISAPSAYSNLTQNLRITFPSVSSDNYEVIRQSDDFKL